MFVVLTVLILMFLATRGRTPRESRELSPDTGRGHPGMGAHTAGVERPEAGHRRITKLS